MTYNNTNQMNSIHDFKINQGQGGNQGGQSGNQGGNRGGSSDDNKEGGRGNE